MDKNSIIVSIICLAYNHEQYIRQCLEGFVMQKTDFAYEVIIHDDASTDKTATIIKEYELKYPHIIKPIYQKENQYSKGVKIGKTFLYPKVQGKYIAECEGDDYWIDPLKLQKQVDFLEKNPNYSMCHTSFKYYYESQKKYLKSNDIEINSLIIDKGLSLEDILTNYRIQTVTVLYSTYLRNIVQEEDPFLYASSYFMMGDTPLWYGLFRKGKIGFIPDVTSVYRKNETSITRTSNYKIHYRFALSSVELRKYLAERDSLSSEFKERINNLYTNKLLDYLAFDKNFTPYFVTNELKDKGGLKYYLLQWGILKHILITRIKIIRYLGYVRRFFIKSL